VWIAGAYVAALAVAIVVGWTVSGISSGAGAPNPIAVAAWADLAATLVVFAFSVALDNSSVYDPYWSLAPIALGSYWFLAGPVWSEPGPAPLAVCVLVLVWAVQIRHRTGRGQWVASLFGFHLLPTVLVFLGCLPLYFVLAEESSPWGILDWLAVTVMTVGIWLEWRSDRELRRFRRAGTADTPVGERLLRSGAWAWCRHPNYLGELLFWWGLALAGLSADPTSLPWSVVGAVAISALFGAVSLPMMERRLARRPGFEEYARCTPLLLPRPPRDSGGP
jgi:steroid 5-alpha reductase family enzyme